MTRHFNVSEVDCLEIAGSAHRLIRSDKTGSTWARLDDDNIRLSFTGDELLTLLAAPDTRLKRGHFSDQSAFRRLAVTIGTFRPCRRNSGVASSGKQPAPSSFLKPKPKLEATRRGAKAALRTS